MTQKNLPELLSPAGSKEAFVAAIDGGADAIYVGGTSFNARINAKNFTKAELEECIKLAHSYGVKVYATLNTLLLDRETQDFLACAEQMAKTGIDALIVADLGAASLLRAHLPDMELHASTQVSAHNSDAGKRLAEMGFSRLVPARELSMQDIKALVENNPLEVEIFTHGALCVSHSGQCLFSSIVGGRSGNRGLCAQPCRLPYCTGEKNCDAYPLSLKDLSLATHITDIIDLGVHSLKIEGRMKSPEYVYAVTKIWRGLLDERRNATAEEMRRLADVFSRGGFTDGYFTKNINRKMLGIRTDADKSATNTVVRERADKITRKTAVNMSVKLKLGEPASLTLIHPKTTVTVQGDTVMQAISSPLDRECIQRSLFKLGDTPFEAQSLELVMDNGVMLPVSRLNSLRRDAVAALSEQLTLTKSQTVSSEKPALPSGKKQTMRAGRFTFPEQITDKAKDYFDKTFLPLDKYESVADGFIMPPVIFDSERERVKKLIDRAIELGADCATVGNIGNLSLLENTGLKIFGDYRFNVTNAYTVAYLEAQGVTGITLSPELTLPQIRDIGGDTSVIVYGRLPLMTLEKCVIRGTHGCDVCNNYTASAPHGNPPTLKDRRGFIFPILREWEHRNVIYNSTPTCMSDKQDALEGAKITNRVFLFTTETAKEVDEVISAHERKLPLKIQTRRI